MCYQGEALKSAVYLTNRVPTKATMKTPYELWMGKKPSLKHLRVWGCPAEARPYKPIERKLDARTLSCYFVGYFEQSRGYKFCDASAKIIFETGNAVFFEDNEFVGGDKVTSIIFEEDCLTMPLIVHNNDLDKKSLDIVETIFQENDDNQEYSIPEIQTQKPQESIPLRRSTREKKRAIPDGYFVYLQEHKVDMSIEEDDPITFHQAMECSDSQKWIEAMKEEIKSMHDNGVWELVPLRQGAKPIGCKWIFKTKRYSNGNKERYKARLVAKGFTQRAGIDYKETFAPISTKDSFRIIMALVAHYNIELHQMDVKTTFLNGDIEETIYMIQPENFESKDSNDLVCKLRKSIYGLKQASHQWYHKFHKVIISYGFEVNKVDNCVLTCRFLCVVKTQRRWSKKIYKTELTKTRYNNQVLGKYRVDQQRAGLTLII